MVTDPFIAFFAFYDHTPRYHTGLSYREHLMSQGMASIDVYYGKGIVKWGRCRMRCYGQPRMWGWSTRDVVEGPQRTSYKRRIHLTMRKRARRASHLLLMELAQEFLNG